MSQARAARRPARTLHLWDTPLQRERHTELLLTGAAMLTTAILLLVAAEPSLPAALGVDLLSAGPLVVVASLGLLVLGLLTSRRWQRIAAQVERRAARVVRREHAELAQSHDSMRSQAARLQRALGRVREREAELRAARQTIARRDERLRGAEAELRRLRERLDTLGRVKQGAAAQDDDLTAGAGDLARAETLPATALAPCAGAGAGAEDRPKRTRMWTPSQRDVSPAPAGCAANHAQGEQTQVFVPPAVRRSA